MRAARILLVALGLAAVGYGGWLWWPQRWPTLPWLLGGPLLHDVLVAPVVAVVGWALGRLLPDRWRRWAYAGLVGTATLLLVAVPLVWRPDPAPPNPGLQDRDYLGGLLRFLVVLWAGALLGAVVTAVRRRVRPGGR